MGFPSMVNTSRPKPRQAEWARFSTQSHVAYQHSLDGMDVYVGLGDTVDEVWSKLLRRPDRFTTADSAHFLNADITSDDYVARYGDDR